MFVLRSRNIFILKATRGILVEKVDGLISAAHAVSLIVTSARAKGAYLKTEDSRGLRVEREDARRAGSNSVASIIPRLLTHLPRSNLQEGFIKVSTSPFKAKAPAKSCNRHTPSNRV